MEELSENLKINNSSSLGLDDSIPQNSLGDENEVLSLPINETTSSKQSQASQDDSSNNALVVAKRGGNKRGRNPKGSLDPPSAPGREGGGWECSICTFRNSTKTFSCEICGTRKGTSTRKPRLNSSIIAQQALAAFDKSTNPITTITSTTTPVTISSPIIDSLKQPAPVALDRSTTLKKSKLNRGKTPKLKPGPKAKLKQPPQDIIPLEDVDCSFKKNLDLAADTLLLLSSTPSPTPHKPLKKRPTLTPPSPLPPRDREEPPSSFLATLMMSSLNPVTPLPPTDAYLNFLHSWKRRGGISPPLTPRAPVIVSPPKSSVPLQFCEYLNQFKNPHLTPQRANEAELPLISDPDPPSVASESSGMDSEDEMYMTRVVGRDLSAYLTTVSPPKQLIDSHPTKSVTAPSPPTPSKCRKKRWMDRLNGLTPTAVEPPDHVTVNTSTAMQPSDHVIATRPADRLIRFESNTLPRDEVMTSLGVVGVKEEGGPDPPNSTRAPNGVIKKTVKLKKNPEETPSLDQYTFDHKAPKTYQVTVNGLTVDITDYPLLTSTPVT